MTVTILHGDCRDVLATLPAASVQCCVTSPPYYGLRDYGVDGQIGLEPTPDEYVAQMMAVFREVRRVLRDDGTLWLNIGDSYAGNGARSSGASMASTLATKPTAAKTAAQRALGTWAAGNGDAKEKDLLGIPWLLAFALRQPYYAGRITREVDRVWLAAMLDGEGCFYIHRRPAGQHAGDGYHRTQDNYQAAFEVANTNEAIIARCMQIAGCGSITRQEKDRRQPLFRWTVRSNEARAIAREIYPYLVAKQQQARLICGMPPSGKQAEAAWEALKALHSGSSSDVDFAAPESMLEPGWYLRSEVIWSKPNPMPESVRDRPTKAHETMFLLTKRAQYFYDADAISEPLEHAPHAPSNKNSGRLGHNGKTDNCVHEAGRVWGLSGTRNARSVWTIATQPYSGAHFATMPPDLAERCIKAGTSERGQCPHCGAPWARQVERETRPGSSPTRNDGASSRSAGNRDRNDAEDGRSHSVVIASSWAPSCECPAHAPVPQTVLDPFGGAGTTGLVADRLQRHALLIELNATYASIARERIHADAPLLGAMP